MDHLQDGADAPEHGVRFHSMARITDEEFDRQIDAVAGGVEAALRKNSWKGYATVAQLHYRDRISIQGLASMDGKPETIEALYEFGKALAEKGYSVPDAVYVTAESVAEDGQPCLFISGCTPDGRRNGIRIFLKHTRWRRHLRPTERIWYPCRESQFEGQTSAGEVMRGLLEPRAPSR